MSISVNAEPLEPTTEFPYLGHTVYYNNIDWAALYQNLRKARRWWRMVANVVKKMGEMVRGQGILYKAFIQTLMLYGSEIWVVTGAMLKVIEGFHHNSSRRIAGMMDQSTTEGE